MIIDLHVHTSQYSKCAVSPADEVMAAAIAKGLDGLVITEHMACWTDQELLDLRQRFPELHIFRAIEVSTTDGEDLLLYGLRDHSDFTERLPAGTVVQRVHEAGGAVVLAHPFRYRDSVAESLYEFPPDACEAWSHNIFAYQRPSIRAFSKETGCGLVAATDSHCAANIGAYATGFEHSVQYETELACLLRKSAFVALQDRNRMAEIDVQLSKRADQARKGIAQGLDTPSIRQQIGGSLSFIDHVRAGQSPCMLDPDESGNTPTPGLHPVS